MWRSLKGVIIGGALTLALAMPAVGYAASHEGAAGNPCNPCAAKNPCGTRK